MHNLNLMGSNHLPSIDLHGMDRDTARILSKEFLEDQYSLGKRVVVIIHGKGKRVLKQEIHEMLKREKIVQDFFIDFFNDGATIVELIEKTKN